MYVKIRRIDELKLKRSCSPKWPGNILDCIIHILEFFDDFIRDFDSELVFDSNHDLNVVQFIDAWRYKKEKYRVPTIGYWESCFQGF